MRAGEVIQEIEKGREQGQVFIRWWRMENDFSDYELCGNFVRNADSHHEIGGFDLLDIEEMWQVLKRWKPTGLTRVRSARGETIEWQKRRTDGTLAEECCPFTPEAIMAIFDYETGGDIVGGT